MTQQNDMEQDTEKEQTSDDDMEQENSNDEQESNTTQQFNDDNMEQNQTQAMQEDDDDDESEYETVTSRFVESILRHLFQGFADTKVNVRIRCCQIIALSISSMGELEYAKINLCLRTDH